MPLLVTQFATITCPHGGRVTILPRQFQVLAGGGSVLADPDLVGAPIVGCLQPATPTTKPCTTVVSTLPGSTSMKVLVGGRPAYVSTLTGATDGAPPAVVSVAFAGQTTVQG